MNVKNLTKENKDYTIGLRHHFHQYLGTRLVAMLQDNKDHPIIGLRTDIDALPVKEDTGLPFASKYKKKSLQVLQEWQRKIKFLPLLLLVKI